MSNENTCWICLNTDFEEENLSIDKKSNIQQQNCNKLEKICNCKTVVHPICLAKWQIQNAGKLEEKQCRFCNKELPHWKNAFKNKIKLTDPILNIQFNGKNKNFKIPYNKANIEKFKVNFMKLFGTDLDFSNISISFEANFEGHSIKWDSIDAFEAAIFCGAAKYSNIKKKNIFSFYFNKIRKLLKVN